MDFEVIHPKCAGLDVHKKSVVAAVCTSEKNRYQNSITISRIRIDCVSADPFGLSATRIVEYLLSDEPFDENKCRSLIDLQVKASKDEIMDSSKKQMTDTV